MEIFLPQDQPVDPGSLDLTQAFPQALEASPDAVVILDEKFRVAFLNRQAIRLGGRISAELVGKFFWEAWPKLVASEIESNLRLASLRRLPTDCSLHHVDDHSDIWIELHIEPVSKGLVLFCRDVTGRKSLEEREWFVKEKLKKSERLLRFRVELSDALQKISDAKEIGTTACRLMCDFLGATRTNYALAFPEERILEVQDGWKNGQPGKGGTYSYSDLGVELLNEMVAGKPLIIEDTVTHPLTSSKYETAYQPLEIRSFISVALAKEDNLFAIVSVHSDQPRRWEDDDVDLLEDLAKRLWYAIERIRADAEVRKVNLRYRALCETVATAVYSASPEGFITEIPVNHGLDLDLDKADLGNSWLNVIHPEDRKRAVQDWRASISETKSYHCQFRLKMADGKYRWHVSSSVPVHDENGVVREWIGSCVDVHERISKERLLLILNDFTSISRDVRSPEAVVDVAQKLIGRWFGASRVIYSELGEEGQTFWGVPNFCVGCMDLNGKFPSIPFSSAFYERMRSGESVVVNDVKSRAEFDEDCRTHLSLQIGAYISVPLLKNGRLVAILGIHQVNPREWTSDEVQMAEVIAERCWSETQRARAEQELFDSERRLRDLNSALDEMVHRRTAELVFANQEMEGFTYSVSHDLRAPLRAIVSTSRILLEEVDSLADHHQELLQRQAYNANRLASLIDELLQLSRLSREELNMDEFDLSDLARDVNDTLIQKERIGECKVKIEAGLKAFGDPRLVRFVLLNLLENAYKFSPNGGEVRVGKFEQNEETVFFVSDQGIGFDMAYSKKLFQPFERLVLDCDFPGTGIGLTNVKRIVERHFGRVWAESEIGKGSTFYFTLCPKTKLPGFSDHLIASTPGAQLR